MRIKFDIVKSIKTGDKTQNIKKTILFELENIEKLEIFKKSLNKLGIIILSSSEYNQPIETFGNIKIIRKNLPLLENITITGILPENDINKTIEDIKLLDLTQYVDYINYLNNPLPEEEINKLLKNIKEPYLKESHLSHKKTELSEKDDEKLKKLRSFIEELIKDGRQLEKRAYGIILPMYINQLKHTIDELEKIKRSRNIEKLISLIEKALNLMEEVELKIIEKEKEKEIQNTVNDSLSELEILPELEKFKRAQKTKGISHNIKLSIKDNIYKYLGKLGLILVLLPKEILKKSKFLNNYVSSFNKYIELFFILIIIELNLYIILQIIKNQGIDGIAKIQLISGILYFLIIFGIYGFLFFTTKFFTNNLKFISRIIATLIILFIGTIMKNIILSSFALPI